jgi:hypothetical protein
LTDDASFLGRLDEFAVACTMQPEPMQFALQGDEEFSSARQNSSKFAEISVGTSAAISHPTTKK